MTENRRPLWWTSSLAIVVCLGTAALATLLASCQKKSENAGGRSTRGSAPAAEPTEGGDSSAIRVKTVRAKRDPKLEVTVEEPAYVEAYYRSNLEARVAGPVKFIQKAIGNEVKAGERLVEIDVPDYVQTVAMKQSIIEQRKADVEVAQANKKIAEAQKDAADKSVKVAETLADAASKELDYRKLEYDRYKKLGSGPSPAVLQDVVDERFKWYEVARANKLAAEATILKSRAELEEAAEKVNGAQADVDLKRSLIRVAEADRDQAHARLELATINAPFDGRIVERGVDPGAFVHDASSSANSRPLFTVERTDIVTIRVQVPDSYAPYVSTKNDAIIEMNGDRFRAKVTRVSPSLQNRENDRTMRIEVDLYNEPAAAWKDFVTRENASGMKDLKDKTLPQLPEVNGRQGIAPGRPLIPGMYGRMHLVIRNLANVSLVPSEAIVRQGGTPYLYIVKNGIAHREQVTVDLDDGKVAAVRLLVKEGNDTEPRDLTGTEEIVSSNQGELSDGQAVDAAHVDW
jgi:multidrug resistance efflux pump